MRSLKTNVFFIRESEPLETPNDVELLWHFAGSRDWRGPETAIGHSNFCIAICAPIAPYAKTRRQVRQGIEAYGAFVEVHVATSIEECERRDRKGLYKLAREGKIKEFTGISDPYDTPEKPELRLDTETVDVDYCAQQVFLKLKSLGLITAESS